MNCKECTEKLVFYIDKELNNNELNTMQEHLKLCSSCNIAYKQLCNKLSVIDKERDLIPNPYLATRILNRIENISYKSNRQQQRILQPAFLIFILIIALFTGFLVGNSYQTIANDNNSSVQTDDLFFNELKQENIELTLLTYENE
ncbi:MAG: zf-HC2 domain-containing protein [Chlorobi bacterium]|nr:zf-HC2 domain-containing protein [Chlorobiota bacterium]